MSIFFTTAHSHEKQHKHGSEYSYKNLGNEYVATKFHEK